MNQKSLGRVGLVAARAQPSVLDLGQTSRRLQVPTKGSMVWNGQCAIMGSVTRVQCELWVGVFW